MMPGPAGPEIDPEVMSTLGRLRGARSRRVPCIRQLESADCGAACLAMVLAHHGGAVPLDRVRAATGTHRGTDALGILNGAEHLGLRGRGVRLDMDGLRYLPRAAILHWDFNHFVVLDRVRRDAVDIVDPAHGRRTVPMEHFRKHFTGVALVFEVADGFVATPPGRSKVWRYLAQLLSQRGPVARVLVMSIALRLLALALPVLTALIVDRVVPRGDHDLLTVVAVGLGLALAFQLLSSLIRSHMLLELRTRLDVRMTLGFVSHLLSLPYAFFGRRSAGDLLLRVASNAQIRDLLTSSLLSTLLDGALAVAYLLLLLLLSPALAAVALGAGGLQLVVLLLSRRRYAQLTSQDLESQARAQSYLVQMLAGVQTLKVAGAESRALESWTKLYVEELNVALQRSRLSAVLDALSGLLLAAAPLVLLAVGAELVMSGQLSLGTMLAAGALASAFLAPLGALVQSALQLQMLGSYVERIDDVLTTEPEQGRGAVRPPRLSGAIELHRVSFRYGPHEPLVVRDVSLTVSPGSMVAIVGRSGSGKSTLAALLLGLYRPTEGRILYDDHDLDELDHRRVRRQLGVVLQSPFIFGGSIRSNLALVDPATPFERIIAAARRACIDDDIRATPMGYETIVADGGASLSGGQRQRLAIARALLHEPAILLLDEATSSLDATTEREVMANLAELHATRILIAHRLSTIASADRIVVMEEGRVVETATHRELMARRGHYHALVQAQTFASEEAP
jgi:ABC-type bacteriocin/lantibiotic exporter with double-glycine peptidase domain